VIVTWNEPEDQIPVGSGARWQESVGGGVCLKGCSDLLEDFLKKISDMESEYQRALDGAS
jgi:hypothetical protein